MTSSGPSETPPGAPAGQANTWLQLTEHPLPIATIYEWAVRPSCGAVVLFSGTVRDHADGRPGVSQLEYEAYEEQVVPRLEAIAVELRARFATVERLAMLHRVGVLELGESSVVVAVSAPHREEAFVAARFGIDAIKSTVPIWKRETWEGGEDWGLDAHDVVAPSAVDDRRAGAST